MKLKCPLCQNNFRYGSGRYEGKPLKLYGITICKPCYDTNHDGFAQHYEEILETVVKKNNLNLPERNASGLLPRE